MNSTDFFLIRAVSSRARHWYWTMYKKDLFAAGDVFVLPSRTDSYGAVFLESWVNKKPVIGAKAGGVSEVIKHGEDGFLVKFGNLKEIVCFIRLLLTNEELAEKMGASGLLKVNNGLSWEDRYLRRHGLDNNTCI